MRCTYEQEYKVYIYVNFLKIDTQDVSTLF